jgi:hypothetical protein
VRCCVMNGRRARARVPDRVRGRLRSRSPRNGRLNDRAPSPRARGSGVEREIRSIPRGSSRSRAPRDAGRRGLRSALEPLPKPGRAGPGQHGG